MKKNLTGNYYTYKLIGMLIVGSGYATAYIKDQREKVIHSIAAMILQMRLLRKNLSLCGKIMRVKDRFCCFIKNYLILKTLIILLRH